MKHVTNILVLGYGNCLRGDDAAGPLAAEAIAAAAAGRSGDAPIVDVRILHQLLPELAEPIAAADLVVFLDAALNVPADAVFDVCAVSPAASFVGRGAHHADPAALLAAARDLFGAAPPALLLSIAAERFDFGAPPSTRTQAGIDAAGDYFRTSVLAAIRIG